MTEAPLTEAEIRALLAEIGLKLDGDALKSALQGAGTLRAQIARLDAFLAKSDQAT